MFLNNFIILAIKKKIKYLEKTLEQIKHDNIYSQIYVGNMQLYDYKCERCRSRYSLAK
jgi:hypothetical protein